LHRLIPERSILAGFVQGDIDRDAAAGLVLEQKMSRGFAAFGRQQPATDQLKAERRQIGHAYGMTQPLGQPFDQMRLLVGENLYRMADLRRIDPMRRHRFRRHMARGLDRRRLAQPVVGQPAAGQSDRQPDDRCGHGRQPAAAGITRRDVGRAQAFGQRLVHHTAKQRP
jgi:hypothetical protein